MSTIFHTTIYCCPNCGTDFEFTDWYDEEKTAPDHEVVLCCPRCRSPTFRVSREERDIIQEYVRLESEVLRIIFAGVEEAEEGVMV